MADNVKTRLGFDTLEGREVPAFVLTLGTNPASSAIVRALASAANPPAQVAAAERKAHLVAAPVVAPAVQPVYLVARR